MIKAYCLHVSDRWDGPTAGIVYYMQGERPDIYYFVFDGASPDVREFFIYRLYMREKEFLFKAISDWNSIGPTSQFYDSHLPELKEFKEEFRGKPPTAVLREDEIEWKTHDWYGKMRSA